MTAVPERPPPPTDPIADAEIRAAARALMRTPLLHDGGGHDEVLRLIRRHRVALTRLFADGLGYRLVVEPGVARLFKAGAGADTSRGLTRPNGTPFTPRRYAMLALTLASLIRSRNQLMIDELVAEVRSAAAHAGLDIDLDSITDRRALHSALLALCQLGVLTEREGDLEHWAERDTTSLLDVHRERLALLVAAPLGQSQDDMLRAAAVPSRVGGARVAVRRRLAEHPVLSVADLTEEQAEWWRRNRNREREWFQQALGLDLELRAEGAVAIDPDGELTDRPFPAGGSARHFALLLVESMVNHLRATRGELAGVAQADVTLPTARRLGDEVFRTWREGFRKAHQADPDALFTEALGVLADAGLVRRVDDRLLVHAAAARYAARPELFAASPTGERSLFDPEEP